jgi:hypothetical protein
VAYTYLMYVVAPYNDALLLYTAAIGLATYGLLNGLFRLDPDAVAVAFTEVPRRGVAVFLFVVGTLFATLWLVDILSVWPGGIPASLIVYDIPSTVHVLDLAIVLPLLFLTGVLLLRGAGPGRDRAGQDAHARAGAAGDERLHGGVNRTLDPAEPALWALVIAAALTWLVLGARRMRPAPSPWLRPTVW